MKPNCLLITLTFSSLLFCTDTFAQRKKQAAKDGPRYNTGIYHPRQPKRPPSYQVAYLGLAGGINNPCGFIGGQIDLTFTQHLSVCAGFGLSSWGTKSGLEARCYLDPANRGWAFALGVTYNSGRSGAVVNNVETIHGAYPVTIDMNPQFSAMAGIGYYFNMGRRGLNRFHLQTGYSIPLSRPSFGDAYAGGNYELTDKGRKTVLALAPGGFILGIGMSFGTGKAREPKAKKSIAEKEATQ